jgi:hypothetical protein
MTIGSTRKMLVIGASVTMLALGAAPASFAGEDDGPTANGERVGSTWYSSSGSSNGSSNGSSSGSNSGSSKSAVKSAQKTHVTHRDTARARGAAQTGFGGMAATPSDNLLVSLLIGLGGAAAIAGARGFSPSNRRADR